MILTPCRSVGPLLDLDIFDNQEVPSFGAPGTLGDFQRQDLTALTPELKDVLPLGSATRAAAASSSLFSSVTSGALDGPKLLPLRFEESQPEIERPSKWSLVT